jgi:ABC-type Na+ efflux pump permease subunit
MNRRAIGTIIWKDLKIARQNRMVMLPMIIVPVLLLVLLPAVGTLIMAHVDADSLVRQMGELQSMLNNLPAPLQAEIGGLNERQTILVLVTTYLIAPLYLIVPLMVASTIASDSFAGERERKTMEALIYTPVTDRDLYLAKLLTAWIPAVVVAWVGFILYSVIINIAAYPVMERIFFPNAMWLVMVIWLAPAAAGLGLAATVLISSRVKSAQEAYQMGGIVVIPLVLLVIGQATGVIYFGVGLVLVLGVLLWLLDAGLFWYGAKTFQRGELIARL